MEECRKRLHEVSQNAINCEYAGGYDGTNWTPAMQAAREEARKWERQLNVACQRDGFDYTDAKGRISQACQDAL